MNDNLRSALEDTASFGNSINIKEYLKSLPLIDVTKGRPLSSSTSKGNQEKWFMDKKFRIAPHFDNGLSLFEHDTKYLTMPLHVCIRKMDGKPFSTDLEKAYKVALEVLGGSMPEKLDFDGIVFPSKKAVEYVERAAKVMNLVTTGTAVFIDG